MKSQRNQEITTVKLNKETKERIDKLRIHKRESYDDILKRMLGILNTCRSNPDEAQEKLEKLEVLKKRKDAA